MPDRSPLDRTRLLARIGALVALGLALFILEGYLLPVGLFLPIPGAKLGLANLATLISLQFDGFAAASVVSLMRVFLAAVMGGTFGAVSFWLSLGGAVCSLLGMALIRLLPGIGPVGISITGAVCHNLGQLAVVRIVIPGTALLFFLPYLIVLGIPAGLVTGLIAKKILERMGGRQGRRG